MILFPDIKDVARNTSVTSGEYTVTENAVISITSTSPTGIPATLLRNGANVGQSYAAQVGDTLQVRMQSSAQFADPQTVVLDLGGKRSFWTTTTVQDATKYINPAFVNLDPYALTHDQDGVSYFPHPANNEITMLDHIGGNELAKTKIAVPKTDGTVDWLTNVVVCSYHDSYLHFVDKNSRQHVGSLQLSGKPYQYVTVRSNPDDVGSDLQLWVTLSDQDRIVVLDTNGDTVASFQTHTRPTGIAVSPDHKHVWVANNEDNSLLHMQWSNGDWSNTYVAVGIRPLNVVCDNNAAYVTCAGSDRVYKVDVDDSATAIVVGNNPRDLRLTANGIWTSIHSERKVVKFNDGGVLASILVDEVPFALCELPSGNMAVTCFDTHSVIEFNENGIVATTVVNLWPYDVRVVNNEVWAMSMWSGTPSYMYYHDRSPYGFTLDVPDELRRGINFLSNVFTVAGINQETHALLVPGYNGTIYRNGVDVGTRTTVNVGDTVQIGLQTPTQPSVEIDTCLYIGSESSRFTTVTNIIDETVDPFTLTKVLNASRSSQYTSNEITITGLETGVTSLLTVSAGVIVLNDVELGTSSVLVQNGDRLRFKMTSSGDWSMPVFCVVDVGNYEAVWTIFTTYPGDNTWYMRASDAGKTIHDVIDFPTLPVAFVDRSKNVLKQYSLSTLTQTASYDLQQEPLENGLTNAPRIYAVDPYDKRMILVDVDDATQNGVERVYDLEGIPYGLSAGPMVAMGQLATSHYVSLYDKDKLQMLGGAGTQLSVQAGTRPMGVACDNYNRMYVAGEDGFLHIFDYNEAQSKFVFSTMFGIPGGGRLGDILVDDSTLYVSDLTLGAVHTLVSGMYVRTTYTGLLPYSITQSGTHVYTLNFGSSSVSMYPKANNGPVTVAELPYGASQPNCIAYDSANSRLFVGSSRAEKVYVLNSNTLELITTLNNVGPVWGLQIVGSNLLILNMWGNLLESKLVGYPRQSPASLIFDQVNNANLNAVVVSNSRFVSEPLARVEKIWIEPFSDATIIKNGARVGWETTIKENDNIKIEIRSVDAFNSLREIRLYSYKYNTPFGVRTMKDVFPDKFVFPTVQNVLPKMWAESTDMEISGLDPTVTVPIKAIYSSSQSHPHLDLTIWINGDQVEGEWGEIKNGDMVRVGCNAYWLPWNGYSTYIYLETDRQFRFATFRIRSSYLDDAIRPPFKLDMFRGPDGVEVDLTYRLQDGEVQLESLYNQQLASFKDFGDLDPMFGRTTPRIVDSVQLEAGHNRTYAVYDGQIGLVAEWNFHKLHEEALYSVEIKHKSTSRIIEHEGMRISIDYKRRSKYGWDSMLGERRPRLNTQYVSSPVNDGAVHDPHRTIAIKTNMASIDYGHKPVSIRWSVGATYHQFRHYALHYVWTYAQKDEHHHRYSTGTEFVFDNVHTLGQFGVAWDQDSIKTRPDTSTQWDRDKERSRYFTGVDYYRFDKVERTFTIVLYAMQVSSQSWSVGVEYTDRVHRSSGETDVAYTAQVFGALRTTTAFYQRGLKLKRSSVNQTTVRSQTSIRKQSPTSQYTRPARVQFDDFVYTATMIRAFNTADQAIAAGIAQQHPVVFAKEMWDTFFAWHVPAEIERVECANTALATRYVKGYVQGG